MKSDSQLQHDVIEELKWEPAVTASQSAWSTPGVRHVVDKMLLDF